MAGNQRKISKQKGVDLCANLLFAGQVTKEILRNLTESYGISDSTVEKWIKAARPITEQLQIEAERIRAIENESAIKESAQRLNITKERVLAEYGKLAFFDIRKLFTVDGGFKPIQELDDLSASAISGIESYDEKERETGEVLGTLRKVKISEKRLALDSLCRVLGYNAPEKMAQTDSEGNDLQSMQILILPPSQTDELEIKEAE